jgi:hypothetical protein
MTSFLTDDSFDKPRCNRAISAARVSFARRLFGCRLSANSNPESLRFGPIVGCTECLALPRLISSIMNFTGYFETNYSTASPTIVRPQRRGRHLRRRRRNCLLLKLSEDGRSASSIRSACRQPGRTCRSTAYT